MTKETEAPSGAFCVDDAEPLSVEELQQRAILNQRYIETSTKKEKIEDIKNQTVNSGLDGRAVNVLHQQTYTELGKISREISGKEHHKYTTQMGVVGVLYMIENKATTDQTLEYVKNHHQKSSDWLSDVRNKKFYTQAEITRIVEEKKQEYISKLKGQNLYNKTFLSTSGTTPIQHLDRVQHLITVSDRLDQMEERLVKVEIENLEFRTRLQLVEENISTIDNCLEISKKGKLIQCRALMEEGYKQREISKILGVHINTVKGYYKEIKAQVEGTTLVPENG